MLDEPTDSNDPADQQDSTTTTTPPAKAPRRRRATKTASPATADAGAGPDAAEAITRTADAAAGGSAGDEASTAATVGDEVTASAAERGATGDAPVSPATGAVPAPVEPGTPVEQAEGAGADAAAGGAEAAAPAKRTRKAPAKKAAAPRKRAPRKTAEATIAEDTSSTTADATAAEGATSATATDGTATDRTAGDAGDTGTAPRDRAGTATATPAASDEDRGATGVAPTSSAGTSDPDAPREEVPLTEEELAAQAALLEAGEPVVTAVEDDPVVAEAAADDVTTPAVDTATTGAAAEPSAAEPAAAGAAETTAAETPAAEAPAGETGAAESPGDEQRAAPVKRTRTRRPAAVVTFQAPEPVDAAPEPPGAGAAEDEQAPAPRRRRRAGTSGALPPSALVPELIEPVPAPDEQVEAETGTAGPTDVAEADEDEGAERPRRRRRGRRGRGPRHPEDESDETGPDADESPDTADEDTDDAESPAAEDTADTADTDEEPTSGTRRRRRRRRSGSSSEDGEESAVATAVREPRTRSRSGATSADEDGVRGITGSTRMAAKRVRRQEGRDSGRKRTAILSEAEFLARREAVDRTMIVRQKGDRTQIAVLEDGILVEHYVTRASAQSYAGNVYLGRVQNVLPSMEAAFVDIGKSRNAVLYAGEVNYAGVGGGKSRSIESVLKSGQEVLVQVTKDPIGHKGARLTGQVSLPGRYLVYVPEGSMIGISRKLPEPERERLKKILKKVVPDEAGVIIRTAAEGASEEEISGDVRRLQAQWEVIQAKAAKGGAPILLHAEPDLVIRVVRDVFNEDFTKLVVQGDSEWETIREYVEFVAPDLAPRLSRHTAERDVFAEHRVDEQLLKALDRKVYLPSGGSLVIDRTEAMVVIDVNTGKFVGKGGNLEETVTRNNLEAAEEIARQLRLRDVGGIIVIDFIDMVLESNRDLVVRRLVECLGRDRTKHQVAEVTSLGLVQMTRKRVGQGLLESFSEPCESCNGRGVHVHPEPVDERRGGGGGDEGRRGPRARASKPLPADAPRPGAGIGDTSGADATNGADSAEDEVAPAPRRRRRGGRGTGAAAVAPETELQELLSDASPAEADAVAAAVAVVDAAVEEGTIGQAWSDVSPGESARPEPTPDLADQPTTAMEDLPADAKPSEITGAVVDAELEIGTGVPGVTTGSDGDGRAGAPAPDEVRETGTGAPGTDTGVGTGVAPQPSPGVADALVSPDVTEPALAADEPLPAPDPAPGADEVAAAPKRRRRATSRPAGPPTV